MLSHREASNPPHSVSFPEIRSVRYTSLSTCTHVQTHLSIQLAVHLHVAICMSLYLRHVWLSPQTHTSVSSVSVCPTRAIVSEFVHSGLKSDETDSVHVEGSP